MLVSGRGQNACLQSFQSVMMISHDYQVTEMVKLAEAFLQLHTPAEIEAFLQGVLAPDEVRHVKHRWEAIQLLLEHRPQREVAKAAKLSIATVSKAAHKARTHKSILSREFGTGIADGREHYLSTRAVSVPVTTLDFCADHGDTDKLVEQVNDVLLANLISVLVGRPAKEKVPLPKGINAHVAQLGDPAYNILAIQYVDPIGPDDAASAQILDTIIHELNHVIQRLKDRRDRLSRTDRPVRPRPVRLS
jgi:uncharacterized protein YerC